MKARILGDSQAQGTGPALRDGRVYLPPFEGTLSQEAVWAIRTYLEERREQQ